MGNDKTYDRHINIWINGKEVKNDVSSIKKEMFNLSNEVGRATRGSKEYNEKAAELKKVKAILKEHQENITATGSAWTKVKGAFSGVQGLFVAGLAGITAGYQSLKGVIMSTDALGDKFTVTLAGWKGGLDALFRSIATLKEGGLTDLGKKIKEGIEEGRRYAESLDEIDEKTRALKILESEAANQLLEQRKIQNDVRKSLTERNDAGKKAIKIEEDLAKIRTDISGQALQNEAKDIASITHLTEQEVLAYAKLDPAIRTKIELGKIYNRQVRELNELQKKSITSKGVLEGDDKKRYDELNALVSNTSETIKRFAFAAANMPGDEKMQLFVDKYVAWQQAMGSATENTLKIQSKQAKTELELTDTKETSEEDHQKFLEKMRGEREKAGVDEMKRLEEQYNEEEKLRQDMEKKMEDADQKRREDREKAGVAEMKRLADENEAIEKLEEDHVAAKFKIAAAGSNLLASIAGKSKGLMKASLIADKAITVAEIIIQTRKANAAIRAWGALGGPIGIALSTAAVIKNNIAAGIDIAAVIAATAVGLGKFYNGGFTAKGSKYEPAGIVHAGEWVANQEMVASPVYGPMIQMLNARQSAMRGYADGGMAGSGQQGAGSREQGAAALFQSDPELKALIRQNIVINNMLLAKGVKANFTYKDVNSMREGMNKLEAIEGDVSR